MSLQNQLDDVVADSDHWPAWKRRECDMAATPEEEIKALRSILARLQAEIEVYVVPGTALARLNEEITAALKWVRQ